MYTKTNINNDNKHITLSRLIGSKLVVIKFHIDINAIKLVPYFNMSDDRFSLFLRKA